MKRNSIITAGILILVSIFGTAKAQRQLLLNEAIDLSLKNSKQLKASSARIEAATASVLEAKQNQLPSFNISSSYIRLTKPSIDLKTKSTTQGNGSPSVSQAVYGIASASYPLYAGGRIKYGIESAKYLEKAAMLDADHDRDAVVINTIDAYVNLYKATEAIRLVKESLASSRKRDSTFSRLEQNGLLARNDLLKSQLQTSNLELSLLDAENDRNLANINMDLMLGIGEETVLVPDTGIFNVLSNAINIGSYEQLALLQRKDLQALSFRQKAAATSTKSARTEGYPTIALTGGYIAADIPGLLSISNAVNFGIGIQYNLSSLWKTNTRLQQAKAREKELKAGEEQLDDAIRLQVNQDYLNYQSAVKRVEVYHKALQQADENNRITKNKYNNSLATVTELLDAEVALTQAGINLAMANADVFRAYNKLRYTTGIITQNNL